LVSPPLTRLRRTSALFPYTTLFRSLSGAVALPLVMALFGAAPGPAAAAEPDCLTPDERRAVIAARKAVPLAQAMHLVKAKVPGRSEEHTSELQSRRQLVCRLLREKK